MSLNLKIKELRKEKNLSVEDLAKRIGVSRQIIYDYESGRVKPSDEKLNLLSKEFDLKPNELRLLVSDNKPKVDSTWMAKRIEELEATNKQLMVQLDRLTRMLESAHLGKPFDVILGGLASLEAYSEAVVVEMYPQGANSVTSEAKSA